jgi:oligopeptide transport system ATP-binding protein
MSAPETLLQVRDLAVRFNTDEGIVEAVNGISYDIGQGESLGIVGESGCGKSVSALAVLRLVPEPAGQITNGEVVFEGHDLLKFDSGQMRRIRGGEIAMVFQDPMSALNPVFTVGHQIVEMVRLHLGLSKPDAWRRAVELLQLVGIPSAADRVNDFPHQFSGGMQQRAMIAMAISCQPKLLIADEPSTALDVTIQAQVVELLARLRGELNMAVILITHDLALVAGFCEHVAVMYAGHIVEYAPVDELFEHSLHPYTLGLLGSAPSLLGDRSRPLTTIPGAPPDQTALPAGCPYTPRCPYVRDACHTTLPELTDIGTGHTVRCLVDAATGNLR